MRGVGLVFDKIAAAHVCFFDNNNRTRDFAFTLKSERGDNFFFAKSLSLQIYNRFDFYSREWKFSI